MKSFEEVVKATLDELGERKIEVYIQQTIDISFIVKGVVFVLATWSGPSLKAFSSLTQALNKSTCTTITLYIVNTDLIDLDSHKRVYGELPQGKGETYWVRNGGILHKDTQYQSESDDLLASRIKEFCP